MAANLLDFGIGLVETDTKVSMDIGRRMAHPRVMEDCQERTAMENERSRVVEAMPGFGWNVAPVGSVDCRHQRGCDSIGVSLEEACGSGWQAAINADALPRLLEYGRSLVASGLAGEVEARLRRVDGALRWLLLRNGHCNALSAQWPFDVAGVPMRTHARADRTTACHLLLVGSQIRRSRERLRASLGRP